MTHLLNTRAALVAEAIDGELLVSGGRLARLDGYPDIRVVLRADWDRSKVAIVSGGGAGHEPAHVGFVGRGMLTAAVCGDVFASPSTDAVLAAILTVAGEKGVLLIVKNYTGDRLNFGLAAERARALGIKVETLIVGDDVALPAIARPRGIAGTLFVHKVAGQAAEAGHDLETVATAARGAAEATRSIGMALSTCTVPGQSPEARIHAGEAELGLGIHGEPGVERSSVETARETVRTMINRLGIAGEAGPFALLINNLGGLPPIELAVVTEAVLSSPLGAKIELVVGPAPMMTSLDMKGFSLSILPLDAERRAALLAPTEAKGWPGATPVGPLKVLPLPESLRTERLRTACVATPETEPVRAAIEAALTALIASKDVLNRLDSKVGDGDTGSTVAHAAQGLRDDLDAFVQPAWGETLLAMAHRTSKAMGGSSGVIASIFLAAVGGTLNKLGDWPEALRAGFDRVAFYGGASEGERTMLDALGPAIRAMEEGGDLVAAAKAAEAGAARTADVVVTSAGRSSYLKAEDLRGVPDPGAIAVAAVLRSLALSATATQSASA
ncbi:dihydroxyacetone kinase [Aliidongia dinghuensis]|uniref:Dihydroxyacetone kinase n=1 Tax=Aliidongia dinghuensis TaxID=1867774 RepID=A0A8J2Z0Z8_9PROT|nr:dihydroxyacetone kinase subunit DhaK [Aliidongia dinghuensis]GGF47450.1 dihydroxyacetone kinase [Aliidongia dinghuensis]